jgi:hypothetical protein
MAENAKLKPCPNCGTMADHFVKIESGMRLALQEAAGSDPIPEEVCPTCYSSYSSSASQGLKLRMERDAREKSKMMMWKNRVHLVKNARNLMSQKAYAEAAVQYEKYIRVLEMVYNLQKGELSPAVFNNSARSKELTVLASIYWDLMRIYDTSENYHDRMRSSAEKLTQFLPYSTIYPDIVKKAEAFYGTCKNKPVVENFLKNSSGGKRPCFIATAVFAAEPYAVELFWLRRFRDEFLRTSGFGRRVILTYYKISPPFAQWLRSHGRSSSLTRWLLIKTAAVLKKNLNSWSRLDVLKK